MKIRIDKIKIPKDRLRYSSGKSVKDLKKSMEEIGQIQEIVVNDAYKLIVGYRRLKAAKELGWKEIDANIVRNLTPFKEFLIELHENWKRKNFTDAELRKAFYKGKQIYEKEHPETVYGANLPKKGEKDFKTKEEVVQDKISVGGFSPHTKKEKKSSETLKPADRYTKHVSKNLNIPERTVREHIQAEDALIKKEVPKQMEKDKSYKIVKHLRELKKKGKKEKPEIIEKKKETKEEPEKETQHCSECKKVDINTCPHCNTVFYKCEIEGEHKFNKKGCKKFERRIS